MKRASLFLSLTLTTCLASAQPPDLEKALKGLGNLRQNSSAESKQTGLDEKTQTSGIKEALAVGTENAVKSLSRVDGYLGQSAVKILMPPSIQKVADVARKAGFDKQVDGFVVSMNRAAEAAAPMAAHHFSEAIRDMTLDDVRGILSGGNTAATDFFRRTTHDKLYQAFKPVVSQKVNEVGATRSYKDMMARYDKLPFMSKKSVDLDDYVTHKSLDGLFYMVGEEEKKIRADPLARTTDLLKSVFGK